jgi:hypothetical protein
MNRRVFAGSIPIHGELLMLGFEVAQWTVSKYMVQDGSPSQSWKCATMTVPADISLRVSGEGHG